MPVYGASGHAATAPSLLLYTLPLTSPVGYPVRLLMRAGLRRYAGAGG
ncbi:MAG: hypothetical protein ACYC5O_11700 [Anaerolineae bacterium]